MTDLITYVIRGIPFGCVFALVAIGLALTYKASRVFNLAFGAQAFVSAAVYYDVRARHDWPIIPAFVLAVVIVGPLTGLILDRALFRYLRTAPAVAKLVVSLGLLVAIPELVKLWFGHGAAFAPPTLWPNEFGIYSFGQYTIDGNQAATSIPLTLAGGLLLGIAQGVLTGYLPLDSILAQGLRPSLPFAALFLLLLFWPGLRQKRELTDPLSGVDPPPPGLAAGERIRSLTYLTWGLGITVVGLGVFMALFVITDFWLL